MNQPDLKSAKIGYLAAILSALLVGSISTLSKPILSNVNPLLLASLVYLLAFLASVPLTRKSMLKPIKKKDWYLILAISGFGSILAPTLLLMGLAKTTASDASILLNGETVFTVLFAILLFKEKLKPLGYLAIILVLIGVIVVTTNLEFSNFLSDLKKEGNLLILSAAICLGIR